ncbi:SubName: Full=Uncharacterized protein {ECO:0000313/EMBL:CCA67962.1} [Serendipita indica DSM 11827]|uniref:Uncharacterized protein n=1 Tax=Serendipita indica (strain DSM 11827) TaxID=1109443 RepID=G4T9G9_SERID|nr:SubName: Full=Uncharacterized protein {ECO:0000313/EMBL:CCA67962.1} [Serendipita indica DSM 11827]CCA67962.1 hypothetical protein PIIN_01829 [Serendipita indica DSM 11827]
MFSSSLTVAVAAFCALSPAAQALLAEGLTTAQVNSVRQQLMDRAHVSWEYGTATTAVLEMDYPDISVYGWAPFPIPRPLDQDSYIMRNAAKLMDERPKDSKTIMEDGAAGDPMSNAITMLLANYSNPADTRFQSAFYSQLGFIEYDVPQTGDGAISHRVSEVQLWADSCFMVPPSFAYWGAIQTDLEVQRKYLVKAYEQLRLYRDHLRDPNSNGLWMHVVMGTWSDVGHWTTGHGWAASGMIRVYQTIAKSALRDELSWALADLSAWAQEIVGAVWDHQRADGSLGNYLRDDSFTDMSGTAFMAAVTYRLGVITDVSTLIPHADRAFTLVKNSIAADGRLQNVVNPYDFTTPYSDVSPEGQGFVLMCQAAWRDYTAFTNGIHHSLSDVFSAFAKAIAAAKSNEDSTPTKRRRHVPVQMH